MRRRVVAFLLALASVVGFSAKAADPVDLAAFDRLARPPLGLPPVPVPADNPVTVEKIALGRKIFFDRRLSINGTLSCAMCHVPEQGYTQHELKTPVGIEGRSIRRNAPTIVNAAFEPALFRDGRVGSLEEQALKPLVDRDEMGNPSLDALIARMRGMPDYEEPFRRAFGRAADAEGLAKAVASWERTMVAGNAPFDRWRFGEDETAVTAAAKRGFELFAGKAGCVACHAIERDRALFTDHGYHNTGVGAAADRSRAEGVRVEIAPGAFATLDWRTVASVSEPPKSDLGRLEVTGDPADRLAYKTPSLRNVALTAPYMHDGSLSTLRDVVRFYNRGGNPNPGLDIRIRPLGLNEAEAADLLAFFESLTSDDFSALVRADSGTRERLRY